MLQDYGAHFSLWKRVSRLQSVTGSVMLTGKVLATGISTVGVGLLVAVALFASPLPRPPKLHFVSLEPAGLVDDAGAELAFLTFSISNAEAFPNKPVDCALGPFKAQNAMLLVPAGAQGCRISFKYAESTTKTKWRLARLAEKLPTYIRYRIPRFWNWVGFEHYGPSSKWQNGSVDLLLPTVERYPSGA
jgi:hypothetical protein